ncbi:hypothetical protein [Burkholderia multivorans]|uniref:hypothetical protein n=1 Tax=Burkholderia multivorans TaxID=87883 RepID=UPI001BA1B9F1|nr:hypothetical protein [Burkholderia multivorans]MBR7899931.1 hypothetical protein [Burkholderia multivorans]
MTIPDLTIGGALSFNSGAARSSLNGHGENFVSASGQQSLFRMPSYQRATGARICLSCGARESDGVLPCGH